MIVLHLALAALPALASSAELIAEPDQPHYAVDTMVRGRACGDTAGPASLCFKARPRPWCKSFLLTEANFYYRLYPTIDFEAAVTGHGGFGSRNTGPSVDTPWYLSADIGWMWNLSTRSAVGGSIFAGYEFGWENYQYGLRGRYRWWLGSGSSLGASAGVVYGSYAGIGKDPGFTGRLTLSLWDTLLLSAALDYVPVYVTEDGRYYSDEPTGYGERFYVGASSGSRLGIVSYAVAGLLALMALGMSG